MATARRLSAALATCRSASRSKTLSSPAPLLRSPATSRFLRFPLFSRVTENGGYANASEGFASSESQMYIPAMLAGFFGFGFVAYADGSAEDASNSPLPLPPESSPIPSHSDLEETAKQVRVRIEELIKSKGKAYGSYPRFTVAVKGQKITVKFKVPPASEIPLLIANIVSNLGVKDDSGSGENMMLRAWDSGVAWQLSLGYPKTEHDQSNIQAENTSQEDMSILISRPLIGSNNAEIEFTKLGMFAPDELEALASVLQVAGQQKTVEGRSRSNVSQSIDKTVSSLEAMGVRIFGLSEPNSDPSNYDISWDNIAGYDQQKREIEDTVLLALQRPEVYDEIARGTRCKFESNRPKAVLFEGPPGTGKTSCARVIANQARVPLMHVPLEVIMSKYFGESERLLGKVFTLANELPNGAIIFLDEVDSFAVARDGETHEATRRVLSVLLRQIDGFEQDKKVVVVAATNRKEDLDPALISRFDCMIYFGLPDEQTRCEIAAQYAKHLTKDQLAEFAKITQNMSGRDIRDVCQQAERSWASKIIRGKTNQSDGEENQLLPPFKEYITSAIRRRRALPSDEGKNQHPNRVGRKNRFDYV